MELHLVHSDVGSLTTPPFTEGVSWVVLDEPITLSAEQIAAFTALFPEGNTRETQPLNDREILTDVRPGCCHRGESSRDRSGRSG